MSNVFMESLMDAVHRTAPSRPHIIAQKDELLLRYKAYHKVQRTFTPGVDFVRDKQGLGLNEPDEKRGVARLFFRYLDPDVARDSMIMRGFLDKMFVDHVDCLLLEQTHDGSSVLFVPADSHMLELEVEDV